MQSSQQSYSDKTKSPLLLHILSLPLEIQLRIFSNLNLPDIGRIAIAGKDMNGVLEIINGNDFWHARFKAHYFHRYAAVKKNENINWLEEFKNARKIEYEGTNPAFQTLLDLVKDGDLAELTKRKADIIPLIHHDADKNNKSLLKWAHKRYKQTNDLKFKNIIDYLFELLPANRDTTNVQILSVGIKYGQPYKQIHVLVNRENIGNFRKYVAESNPLHRAARYGRIDILELLLERGADINSNVSGVTPLFMAVEARQLNSIKILLKNNALHSALTKMEVINYKKKPYICTGDYPIHLAVKLGYSEIVDELLVKYPASMDTVNTDNATNLLLAIEKGHVDIVKKLLDLGAQATIKLTADANNYHGPFGVKAGDAAMHAAVLSPYPKMVEILLEKGADPDIRGHNNNTPLHYLAEHGKKELLLLILQKNPSLDLLNDDRSSALSLAIKNGHTDIVKILLSNGADSNIRCHNNNTPLHYVAEQGKKELLALILEKNPSLDLLNDDNWSALGLALKNGHIEVVQQLLQLGAKTDIHSTCKFDDACSSSLELFYLITKVEALTVLNQNTERDNIVTELKNLAQRARQEYANNEEKIQELIGLIKPKFQLVEKVDRLIKFSRFEGLKHDDAKAVLTPARHNAIEHSKSQTTLAYQGKISLLQLEQELIELVNLDKAAKQISSLSYAGRTGTYKKTLVDVKQAANQSYLNYASSDGQLSTLKKIRSTLYSKVSTIFTDIKNKHDSLYGTVIRIFGRSKANDDFIKDLDDTSQKIKRDIVTIAPIAAQFIKLVEEIETYPDSAAQDIRQVVLQALRDKAKKTVFDYSVKNTADLINSLSKDFDQLKLIDNLLKRFNVNLNRNSAAHQNAINQLKNTIDKVFQKESSFYELEQQLFVFHAIESLEKEFLAIQYRGNNEIILGALQSIRLTIKNAFNEYANHPENSFNIVIDLEEKIKKIRELPLLNDPDLLNRFRYGTVLIKINAAFSSAAKVKNLLSQGTVDFWYAVNKITNIIPSQNPTVDAYKESNQRDEKNNLLHNARNLVIKSISDQATNLMKTYHGNIHDEINSFKSRCSNLEKVDKLIVEIKALVKPNDNPHRIQAINHLLDSATKTYRGTITLHDLKRAYALFCEIDTRVKLYGSLSYQGNNRAYLAHLSNIHVASSEAYSNFSKATNSTQEEKAKDDLIDKFLGSYTRVEEYNIKTYGYLAFFGKPKSDGNFVRDLQRACHEMGDDRNASQNRNYRR